MGLLSRFREELRRRKLSAQTPEAIFSSYFHNNKWRDPYSRSGKGSNIAATAELRVLLPTLLRDLQVCSMVDVPCGDFFWMQHVDLEGISYLGGDIVPEMISRNSAAYAGHNRAFQVIDLITDPVPNADLIFVRDCLVHLSHDHVKAALTNIRQSGSKWLLTTVYPATAVNENILTGQWRALNLIKDPFNLPAPARMIPEGCAEEKGQGPDKHLALWRINDLPVFSAP